MARFSLFGGSDDEEEEAEEQQDRDIGGSSRRTRKKPRLNPAHGGSTSGEQVEDRILEIDPPAAAGSISPIETDGDEFDCEPEAVAIAEKPVSVWLTDTDVLDCCICFEPLTIPVFQCENGHIACSSCCTKIRHKCASCSWPIGYNRCRAIEKVLESLTTACRNKPHGCKETVSYSQKTEHEKACNYMPCSCPLVTCTFLSSYEQLKLHFATCHSGSAHRFCFNDPIRIELKAGVTFSVLQEEKGNDLFVLHQREERLGSVTWLSSVSAGSSEGAFGYKVFVGRIDVNIALKSVTTSTRGRVGQSIPPDEFLVVPPGFLRTAGTLALELTILKI